MPVVMPAVVVTAHIDTLVMAPVVMAMMRDRRSRSRESWRRGETRRCRGTR
jgi:hypothetical protein